MKKIVFDTGPLITLSLNNLLWLIEPLKKHSKAEFLITSAVKKELIDRPLQTKKFKFEAMRTMQYIKNGTIKVVESKGAAGMTSELLELANHCFKARGQWIKLLHYAEVESIAYAILENVDAFVVDERTMRMLIEDCEGLKNIMKHKLRTSITMNHDYIDRFHKKVKNIKMLRSVELISVAYELGLLDKYMPDIPNPNVNLLDSVLWALKLHGCAVSGKEISQIIKIEKARR